MEETREAVHMLEADVYQGPTPILQDVNFHILRGEFVYLVGRTGSGKSSLLKTLYADLKFKRGKLNVVGFDLARIALDKKPFFRRRIGVIFQDFQLLFDRTVTDNLQFVLRATGWRSAVARQKRLAEVLMQVGLGAVSNKMPHQLSGGQQQRLAIARALLNEPVILFADEPTGNLDPEVSEGIMKLFIDINNAGTAVLMATHNHNFISKYPFRVLQCQDGLLIDSLKEDVIINEQLTITASTKKIT